MRAWVVRFVSLYVFDVAVLLLIGAFTPGVVVGWSAFWAAVLLTAATIWLKPLIHRWFVSMAAGSASRRSKMTEKLVQYLLVLAVAAIIWIIIVNVTAVYVYGFFSLWGWVAPPVALTIAWTIYDLVDDAIEARAGRLFDRATNRSTLSDGGSSASIPPAAPGYPGAASGTSATPTRRRDDGLTDEQRRLLDEL